jgi:hypothetical protein
MLYSVVEEEQPISQTLRSTTVVKDLPTELVTQTLNTAQQTC